MRRGVLSPLNRTRARNAIIEHGDYRHAHAALTLDAILTLAGKPASEVPASNADIHIRRRRAVAVLAVLLFIPLISIAGFSTVLGDGRGLALGTLFVGLALELPDRTKRALAGRPTEHFVPARPAVARLWIVSIAEIFAPPLVAAITSHTVGAGFVDGLLWGAALAGGLDLARTCASILVASWAGEPAYARRFRWNTTDYEQSPSQTWPQLAAVAADRPKIDEFRAYCTSEALTFAVAKYGDDHLGLLIVWRDGEIWFGNDAFALPLSAIERN